MTGRQATAALAPKIPSSFRSSSCGDFQIFSRGIGMTEMMHPANSPIARGFETHISTRRHHVSGHLTRVAGRFPNDLCPQLCHTISRERQKRRAGPTKSALRESERGIYRMGCRVFFLFASLFNTRGKLLLPHPTSSPFVASHNA